MSNQEISQSQSYRRPSQTKIVATVGPACDSPERLLELIRAGVDVFRINTAHGSRADHQRHVERIRQASSAAGQLVAILVDLAGPKIRLHDLPGGQLECVAGQTVRFGRAGAAGAATDLTTTYPTLVDELSPGDRVLLADGLVALRVESRSGESVVCRVVQGGVIRSRQGVNLPGVTLSAPAISAVDREAALWAAAAGVDFISLSFVRRAADLEELRTLVAAVERDVHLVAKIEKPEALAELEAIVEAADAVMVARGDLGVEIDIADVPVVQKRIISACNAAGKPVIVATQMLDSMQRSQLPTRAEAADVANAILDGADACMLSGETAVGMYPRESVETMHRIALSTEPLMRRRLRPGEPVHAPGVGPVAAATAFHAGRLAEAAGAALILILSASGATARVLSASRLFVPTVGASDSPRVLRRMCLYWGVIPLADAPTAGQEQLLRFVEQRGRSTGTLAPGDRMLIIAGTGLQTSIHNTIIVHEVGERPAPAAPAGSRAAPTDDSLSRRA